MFLLIKAKQARCGTICFAKITDWEQKQYWPWKCHIVSSFKTDLSPVEVRSKVCLATETIEGSRRSFFKEKGIKLFPISESPHPPGLNSGAERQGDLLLNFPAVCPGACCVLLHLCQLHNISCQRTPCSTGVPQGGCVFWHISNWQDCYGSWGYLKAGSLSENLCPSISHLCLMLHSKERCKAPAN